MVLRTSHSQPGVTIPPEISTPNADWTVRLLRLRDLRTEHHANNRQITREPVCHGSTQTRTSGWKDLTRTVHVAFILLSKCSRQDTGSKRSAGFDDKPCKCVHNVVYTEDRIKTTSWTTSETTNDKRLAQNRTRVSLMPPIPNSPSKTPDFPTTMPLPIFYRAPFFAR